jgi:transposase InsO family protein
VDASMETGDDDDSSPNPYELPGLCLLLILAGNFNFGIIFCLVLWWHQEFSAYNLRHHEPGKTTRTSSYLAPLLRWPHATYQRIFGYFWSFAQILVSGTLPTSGPNVDPGILPTSGPKADPGNTGASAPTSATMGTPHRNMGGHPRTSRRNPTERIKRFMGWRVPNWMSPGKKFVGGLACLVVPEWALMMSAMTAELNEYSPPPVLDSGASCHLCPLTPEYLEKVVPGSMVRCVKQINTAGSGSLESTHSVTLLLSPEGAMETIPLHNVLLVPGLRRMLLSVPCLTDEGRDCLFTKHEFHLLYEGKRHLSLPRSQSLFTFPSTDFVNGSDAVEANLASTYTHECPLVTLHHRLGHVHYGKTARILSLITGKPAPKHSGWCECCVSSKICKTSFPQSARHVYTNPLELLGVDQCGPFRIRDPSGRRYFALIVDYKSNYRAIYRSRNKSALPDDLTHFIDMAERQQQPLKVVAIIGDGALVGELKAMLEGKGIRVIVTAPGSSESNGKVERSNRTVCEAGRAMTMLANLPHTFFLHACVYVVHILNHLPDKRNPRSKLAPERHLSAVEVWTNQDYGDTASLLQHLRVFGCLTDHHSRGQAGNKGGALRNAGSI